MLITWSLCCVLSVHSQTTKPNSKTTTTKTTLPQIFAETTSVLSKPEQELLDEINFARANPSAYIEFLEQYRVYYQDKSVHFPDGSKLLTNEGVAALDDAIAFLRTVKPLSPLELRTGMVSGAKLHLADLQKTGGFGHRGSDGSMPEDRLSRFGMWEESVGEDIVYDSRGTRNDVIGMIIDDGVSTRGHRKNLFKPGYRVIGVAVSPPRNSKLLCVVTFAGGFVDRGDNKKPTASRY